jgi:hypothetical protein
MGTSSQTTANLVGAEVTGYFPLTAQYRFGVLEPYYSVTPSGLQGAQYSTAWKNMAMYGNGCGPGRWTDASKRYWL